MHPARSLLDEREGGVESRRGRADGGRARDRDFCDGSLVRGERDGVGGGCFRQGDRNRIEGQAGAADEVIEAVVGELHGRTVNARRQAAASLGAPRAAYFEDVDEISRQVDADLERYALLTVIDETDSLVRMSFGQEPAAEDVNQIALDRDDASLDHIGIRQVGPEQLVVRARARAEEQRRDHRRR